MDFEGRKYKKAIRAYKEAEVAMAKIQLRLNKAKAAVKTTPSLQREEKLKEQIERMKRRLFILKTRRVRNYGDSTLAVEAEHRAAKELDAFLAESMEKLMAMETIQKTDAELKVEADQQLEA